MKKTRFGFTVIELLVAVAIISIVSSYSFISLQSQRRTSRDTTRLSDIKKYTAGLQQYRITNPNFFISAGTGTNCVLPNLIDPATQDANYRTNCTGASGRSYGMMHLHSVAGAANPVYGSANRPYSDVSIAQGLKNAGVIATIARDPLSKSDTDPLQPDFVIVRCCVSGMQNVGVSSSIFAIAATLERSATGPEADTTPKNCGGTSAYPAGYPNYVYDYASPTLSQFSSNLVIIGNSVPKSLQAKAEFGDRCTS